MLRQIFFKIISCLVAIASIISCNSESKQSFIANFEVFMEEIGSNSKNYSNVDWQNADAQFADFKDNQLLLWEDSMTPDEKTKVNELIGKYQAQIVKRGINEFKDQVNDVIDQTKTMFDELTNDTTLTQ